MDILLLHGNSFYFQNESFGPNLIQCLEENHFYYKAPRMPLGEQTDYKTWKPCFDKIKGEINSETIIIAHSLSGLYLPRFLNEENLKPYATISIASGKKSQIASIIPNKYKNFISRNKDFEYVRNNVPNRFCIYSNGDHIFSLNELTEYARSMNSKILFLENKGHFGRSSGVKAIPELNKLVVQLEKNLSTSNQLKRVKCCNIENQKENFN